MKGMVKRLLMDKGFGFIRDDVTEKEFFFHRTSVLEGKFYAMEEGAKVEFEEAKSERGLRAQNVTLL